MRFTNPLKSPRFARLSRSARIAVGAASLTLLLLAGFTVHGFVLLAARPDPFAHLVEPPPGPRAPDVDVLGLRVGHTTVDELNAWLAARAITCTDATSIAKDAALSKTPVHPVGDAPANGAPSSCPFKLDAGVQVRLTCDVQPWLLGPRFAQDARAQLTFLFDSADHPLRYVMIDRKLDSQRATHGEWTRATENWGALLGAPSARSEEPTLAVAEQKAFPRFKIFRQEWRYSDRRVEVQAMNFGAKKGIDVREIVEIPWPIRSL